MVLFLVVVTASAALIAWFALKHESDRPMAFDREHWLQARRDKDFNVLSRMARDLVERKALIGESRAHLIELLGAPEKYQDATDRQMYYLIRENWNWIDPVRRDHLLIAIDENGRAVDARIDVFRKKQQ
jgi:glycine/D-amino acid oxidase-like deaminating enzyme